MCINEVGFEYSSLEELGKKNGNKSPTSTRLGRADLEAWPKTPLVILSAAKNLFIHWIPRPFVSLRVTEIDFPARLLDAAKSGFLA